MAVVLRKKDRLGRCVAAGILMPVTLQIPTRSSGLQEDLNVTSEPRLQKVLKYTCGHGVSETDPLAGHLQRLAVPVTFRPCQSCVLQQRKSHELSGSAQAAHQVDLLQVT